MKQIKMTVVLLCMGGLSLTGCERLNEKPLSAEAEACRARIAAFRANVGLNDVKLRRERTEIGEQTLSLTNAEERIMLFREFVKEFHKIDIVPFFSVNWASCKSHFLNLQKKEQL
jgi:hypothetical protein